MSLGGLDVAGKRNAWWGPIFQWQPNHPFTIVFIQWTFSTSPGSSHQRPFSSQAECIFQESAIQNNFQKRTFGHWEPFNMVHLFFWSFLIHITKPHHVLCIVNSFRVFFFTLYHYLKNNFKWCLTFCHNNVLYFISFFSYPWAGLIFFHYTNILYINLCLKLWLFLNTNQLKMEVQDLKE